MTKSIIALIALFTITACNNEHKSDPAPNGYLVSAQTHLQALRAAMVTITDASPADAALASLASNIEMEPADACENVASLDATVKELGSTLPQATAETANAFSTFYAERMEVITALDTFVAAYCSGGPACGGVVSKATLLQTTYNTATVHATAGTFSIKVVTMNTKPEVLSVTTGAEYSSVKLLDGNTVTGGHWLYTFCVGSEADIQVQFSGAQSDINVLGIY